MSKKTGFKKFDINVGSKADEGDLSEAFHEWTGQKEQIRLIPFEELKTDHNPYLSTDLQDLIDSICQYGLEQNLVVKRSENTFKEYTIKTGHRRYAAIKYILENLNQDGNYDDLLNIYCKVIEPNENDILVHMRMHETNLQVRNLLKLPEEEKLLIVEDYIKWLDLAREQKLEINGKAIKGKTRDILAERFGIAKSTAGELIAKVKNDKGAEIGTPQEQAKITSKKFGRAMEKLIDMMNQVIEEDNFNEFEKAALNSTANELQDAIIEFKVSLTSGKK